MEITIGGFILAAAVYIIFKSVKKSSDGKCSSGCEGCSHRKRCNKN